MPHKYFLWIFKMSRSKRNTKRTRGLVNCNLEFKLAVKLHNNSFFKSIFLECFCVLSFVFLISSKSTFVLVQSPNIFFFQSKDKFL